MHGGAADRSGLIFPNDEVIEVNGIEVGNKTPDEVLQILKNSEGTITFKLIPADSGKLKVIINKKPSELKFNSAVLHFREKAKSEFVVCLTLMPLMIPTFLAKMLVSTLSREIYFIL